MAAVTVAALELARVLNNALAFVPAVSRFKQILILISPDASVYSAGTDGYAAGTDTAEGRDYEGPAAPHPFLINRKDVEALDAYSRKGRKEEVRITANLKDFTVKVAEEEPLTVPVVQDSVTLAHLEAVNGYISEASKRTGVIPGVVAIDPGLLSRFSKVKCDKTQRAADLLFGSDRLEPLLVKIGPTFKGLVMPLDREIHGNALGQEGLW